MLCNTFSVHFTISQSLSRLSSSFQTHSATASLRLMMAALKSHYLFLIINFDDKILSLTSVIESDANCIESKNVWWQHFKICALLHRPNGKNKPNRFGNFRLLQLKSFVVWQFFVCMNALAHANVMWHETWHAFSSTDKKPVLLWISKAFLFSFSKTSYKIVL